MHALFIARSTLYKDKGGDTIQILQTAGFLEKLGVSVTIRLTGEPIDYQAYDLLHFFNIIRPADIIRHVTRSKKPFAVSTIYVDYAEYERTMRRGIAGLLFRTFSPDLIEYAKVIARFVVNGEKILSPSYLWLGQRRSIRQIIRKAAILLPNSHSEYERLVAHYKVPQRYRVIPNAIDPSLFRSDESLRDPHLVLCVGRIEGRKNQLNLIRALRGTPFRLICIGASSTNQQNYYAACREAAGPETQFIDPLPQEQLTGYYQRAFVHVLPSWFETTGLSSLEAAAMGCRIVITDKGDTREYFGDDAFYCDPGSPASIRKAVETAAASPFSEKLRSRILSRYTWEQTAKKTLEAYAEMLNPL